MLAAVFLADREIFAWLPAKTWPLARHRPEAEKLILPGASRACWTHPASWVRELRPQQVPAHRRAGRGYQAELLDAAAQACRAEVSRPYRQLHRGRRAARGELFTRTGNGTLVARAVRTVARAGHRGPLAI